MIVPRWSEPSKSLHVCIKKDASMSHDFILSEYVSHAEIEFE